MSPRPGDDEKQIVRVGTGIEEEIPAEVPWWVQMQDVHTELFGTVMGGVILCNAMLMGLETDCGEDNFVVFEHILCCIYTVEFSMQVWQNGPPFWAEPSNLFDCLLVSVGIFDLWILPVFASQHHAATTTPAPLLPGQTPGPTTAPEEAGGGMVKMLRILRLMRVLRVLRLFKMFKSLAMIMSAFMRAFNIVMWVAVLTLIIDYVCAIFLTRVVGHNHAKWGDRSGDVEEWFGTIPKSMRTLFIVMTLAQWDEIALVISQQLPAGPVFGFFVFYILVAAYTMVSLITGVLDESLKQARSENQETKLHEIIDARDGLAGDLASLLSTFDVDGDGSLEVKEFEQTLLNDPLVLQKLAVLEINLTEENLMEIFDMLSEGTGKLPIETLVEGMLCVAGMASAAAVHHIQMTGRYSFDELLRVKQRMDSICFKHEALGKKVLELATSLSLQEQLQDAAARKFDELTGILQTIQLPSPRKR